MKVGICTFTDGRKRVADMLREDCFRFQSSIANWLREEGYEVVEAKEVIWNYATARSEGARLRDEGCDVVIFNFCVWSFPDFTVQTAQQLNVPILLLGNINPAYPGWVAFFASAGALDEVGRHYGRALGDISDRRVQDAIRNFIERHNPDRRKRGIEVVRAQVWRV
jgi:L-fucose isomerase-like protein